MAAPSCEPLRCSLRNTRCSVARNGTDSFSIRCTNEQSARTLTAHAYPRYIADTLVAHAGRVSIISPSTQDATAGCKRLSGHTVVLTPPPTHTFHFFLEWAFHLFALLAANQGPLNVLFLPPATREGQRRSGRLDAWCARVFHGLLRHFGTVWHATDGQAYCLQNAQIGLVPQVSLLTSRCVAIRRLADARGHSSCTERAHTDEALPPMMAHARSLSNCSLTRLRLKAFRGFVRARIGAPTPSPASFASSAAGVRVLLVQRNGPTRRLLGLAGFAERLGTALRARLRLASSHSIDISIADFTADLAHNAELLQSRTALVAVHGNALTNLLLAPSRGLRAAVQLLPACLPKGTLSNHAYEVLGHLLLSGRFRSVCCACQTPRLGKSSQVTCNATTVADALAGSLRRAQTY